MKHKKSASHSLRSMLTEATPMFSLPRSVVQQLVRYYGDWRRSRDILNDADEAVGSHTLPGIGLLNTSYTNPSGSLSPR